MASASGTKDNRRKRKLVIMQQKNARLSLQPLPSKDSSNEYTQGSQKFKKITIAASTTQQIIHSEDEGSAMSNQEKFTPLDLGSPYLRCKYCGAMFWLAERVRSNNYNEPIFSTCCQKGKTRLPLLRPTPQVLDKLLDCEGDHMSKHFRSNIRAYNSMFAFTSIGGKIDREINNGGGPYIFRLNGQNHHRIGSLLPNEGEPPRFAQLYIYDTSNEIKNRMEAIGSGDEDSYVDPIIVKNLIEMFNFTNELVKAFRMARDRFSEKNQRRVTLQIAEKRREDTNQYNPPSHSEIAALVVGDFGVSVFPQLMIF